MWSIDMAYLKKYRNNVTGHHLRTTESDVFKMGGWIKNKKPLRPSRPSLFYKKEVLKLLPAVIFLQYTELCKNQVEDDELMSSLYNVDNRSLDQPSWK